jgi:hypothetical protein
MDSELVVKFLEKFNRLKKYCSGNPDNISEIAETNDECHTLCVALYSIASDLRTAEFAKARAFSSPTNPIFVKAWREWLLRFEKPVSQIAIKQLFSEGYSAPIPVHSLDAVWWECAQVSAIDMFLSLERLLGASQIFAEEIDSIVKRIFDVEADGGEEMPPHEAWQTLKEKVGFDPIRSARRRLLMPFVLVPRKVGDKVSLNHKSSLLHILEDAQRAFIFGANNAAVALLRSIMENVLREHYGAEGGRLDELIGSVWNRLPQDVKANKLDKIRRLANSIMHLDSFRRDPWSNLDEKQIEKEIVEMFKLIGALIEGVN